MDIWGIIYAVIWIIASIYYYRKYLIKQTKLKLEKLRKKNELEKWEIEYCFDGEKSEDIEYRNKVTHSEAYKYFQQWKWDIRNINHFETDYYFVSMLIASSIGIYYLTWIDNIPASDWLLQLVVIAFAVIVYGGVFGSLAMILSMRFEGDLFRTDFSINKIAFERPKRHWTLCIISNLIALIVAAISFYYYQSDYQEY